MEMTRGSLLAVVVSGTLLSGCLLPNTYYDPIDPYAHGRRWYDRGRYDLAAHYWDPLVEKGDCDAEYWVGTLYFLGQGRTRDLDKALALWRKAANGNQPKALAAMGDLYYQNESVVVHHCKACALPKDFGQAYVWYKLLERSARYEGEKRHAAAALKSIRAQMASEQLSQAEVTLSEWKPTPKDCEPRKWW
jgi:TPR repeat protein